MIVNVKCRARRLMPDIKQSEEPVSHGARGDVGAGVRGRTGVVSHFYSPSDRTTENRWFRRDRYCGGALTRGPTVINQTHAPSISTPVPDSGLRGPNSTLNAFLLITAAYYRATRE